MTSQSKEQDMRYPPGAKSAERKAAAASPLDQPAAEQPAGVDPDPSPDLITEILTGIYRAEGMATQGFHMLRQRLDALERRMFGDVEGQNDTAEPSDDKPAAAPAEETGDSTPTAEGFAEQSAKEVVAEVVNESARQPADEPETFPELPPTAAPVAETPPLAQAVPQPAQPVRDVRPVAAPGGGDLAGLLFGEDARSFPSLAALQQQLVQDLQRGDEDALGLAGHILIVRAATMDRLPTLLKDVGEAWFRWRPDSGGDGLRDALIGWLHARLEAVGLGNRIELVRLGDRYDSKRHNAKTRGVEVTGVHGWVVLRDNGNVYTKATVSVA